MCKPAFYFPINSYIFSPTPHPAKEGYTSPEVPKGSELERKKPKKPEKAPKKPKYSAQFST
jgi:hypothetical protein